MSLINVFETTAAEAVSPGAGWAGLPAVRRLIAGEEDEALAYLAERPVHTTILAGWLREYGLASGHQRGDFYGCRSASGVLSGLALFGRNTVFEARTDEALAALALHARSVHPGARMILGEAPAAEKFWGYYVGGSAEPPRVEHEILYELRWPVGVCEETVGLRQATRDDVPLVTGVQAEMAEAETGSNPLKTDPSGFRARYKARVERGHVWVLVEHGRLVFKADVTAATPHSSYLEGVYVTPESRGRGVGGRCLSQLARHLLRRTPTVCLFANERNARAHSLYLRVGFKRRARFSAILPSQPSAPLH